jgi:hypothetical protein
LPFLLLNITRRRKVLGIEDIPAGGTAACRVSEHDRIYIGINGNVAVDVVNIN